MVVIMVFSKLQREVAKIPVSCLSWISLQGRRGGEAAGGSRSLPFLALPQPSPPNSRLPVPQAAPESVLWVPEGGSCRCVHKVRQRWEEAEILAPPPHTLNLRTRPLRSL